MTAPDDEEIIEIIDPDDPGGDDPIIVPDDGSEEVIDYDGSATLIRRAFSADSAYLDGARSYTQVDGGKITFGYRDANSGTLHPVHTMQPDAVTISSTVYRGLAINSPKIQIKTTDEDTFFWNEAHGDGHGMYFRIGNSKIPATGYMQVITSLTKSQANGVEWTVEAIPFFHGFCVASR